MANNKICNLCWTACIWCAGWRCKWCWFKSHEAELSNSIIEKINPSFEMPWLLEFYKKTIKDAKDLWNNEEDVIGMIQAYKTPEDYVAPIIKEKVPVQNLTVTDWCEYQPWALWARDTCKLCWTARFYGQNKPCITKIKK